MARKFAAQGVSGLVPMVVAQVTGVGVGFAAHVAAAGYVPTAPLPSDATQDLAVLLLDPSQVVALDATEPNYRRAVLDAARTEVVLPSGEVLTSVAVYAGERGMLGVGGDRCPTRAPRTSCSTSCSRPCRRSRTPWVGTTPGVHGGVPRRPADTGTRP